LLQHGLFSRPGQQSPPQQHTCPFVCETRRGFCFPVEEQAQTNKGVFARSVEAAVAKTTTTHKARRMRRICNSLSYHYRPEARIRQARNPTGKAPASGYRPAFARGGIGFVLTFQTIYLVRHCNPECPRSAAICRCAFTAQCLPGTAPFSDPPSRPCRPRSLSSPAWSPGNDRDGFYSHGRSGLPHDPPRISANGRSVLLG
jgi:hypothetical protein